MDGTEFTTLVGACTAFLALIGGGIRWYIARIDTQDAKEDKKHDDAILQLRNDMQKQIDELASLTKMQSAMIRRYADHVRKLEILMASAGMEIPELNLALEIKNDDR